MQLKAIISNRAKEGGVPPQLVMQSYLLERLLERISLSLMAYPLPTTLAEKL